MTICLKYDMMRNDWSVSVKSFTLPDICATCSGTPAGSGMYHECKREGGSYVIITGSYHGNHPGLDRISASQQFRTSRII